jgi:N,N-dimethylformamidase beta subunit-like protein/uncharacterized protein DUF4082/concanavalin A-like lectin/glucanase superfamily protein/fibronectin type III domain protein/Big-like domain-containing protein/BACON domain-containing protein
MSRLLPSIATAFVLLGLALPATSLAACANPVACENAKAGSAPSTWQVNGIGDSTIQGYATSMSVNLGGTIRFKVKTTASAYHIDVYRLGYYGGDGARLQASNILPSATLPQTQPSCLTTASTGLIDCGNWAVSASWTVPTDAVSGLYVARLVRNDTGGASQIPFVVRDDSSHSDILLKTSDATWQAYNAYGGNSLYGCTSPCPPGNPLAYKGAFSVSYNRPFDGTLTADGGKSDPFYAEYQMIRFIERNGYDVSYVSQPDVAASPSLLLNHKLMISSAHDEYWSGQERANVEAARDAGVSLAFFSGNEVFWKTRWENSTADGGSTPYRTLTTYKDTHFDAPTDPVAWTGTWADPRFSPPGDGGRPPNALTGQEFVVNSGTSVLTVPAAYKALRLWRNTAVANLSAGQSRTLGAADGDLGYEWDIDVDNGFRPAGEFDLSSTTVTGVESFTDYGSKTDSPTTQTHHLTEYRAPSGALVFGAGTVQWSWGLDDTNAWNNAGPPSGATPDPVMQQATVNLFADMGAQPTTLMSGLVAASQSTDTTAPVATITSPTDNSTVTDGSVVSVTGTASDSGGAVAGVEVSTDGGKNWHPATGTSSWSYSWNAHGAPSTTVMARAVDDSGNLQSTPPQVTVNVGCPCSMAGPSVTPWTVDETDTNSVEVGVKFKADLDGTITGVRFYKSSLNTGTHVGNLWTANGTLLATGTFSGETATGWQQLNFSTPVDIAAGTTYVASYFAPKGHYSASSAYFYMPSPVGGNSLDSPPLHAISANGGGANGVYSYSTSSTFPTATYNGENYAVDVLFTPKLPPGAASLVTATAGPGSATVSWLAPATGGPPSRYIVTPYVGTTAQPPVTVTGNPPATSVVVNGLDPSSSYTFTVQAANGSGSGPVSTPSNAVTPTAPTAPGAPTAVSASAGNAQATVRWTAPSDGGRTITRYTVTPYVGGVAQTSTPVTGSPAPTTATVTGLANGTSYTFTVKATNSIGDGPESAPSNAVTPNAAPRFVQRVSTRGAGSSVQLTPSSAVAVGDRMVVTTGAWSSGGATISGVTDSAGNTYTKATSVKAPDNTELSVWSAPITAGDGTKPTITVTATGSGDIGAAALEYANVTTATGAAAIDQAKTAVGTTSGAGTVSSGATSPLTAGNELELGFYVDSGFGNTLGADPSFTERVNVSPTGDMEFEAQDAIGNLGDTPAAHVATGASTPWAMATVVFKSGAPSPPTLAVSPASLSFSATAGGASPAAKTVSVSNAGGGTLSWLASENASWLAISPTSGTNSGTITVTPSITGLAAGTYTTDITISAAGAGGSPKTVTVTLIVNPPTPPALSASPTSLAFNATQGGADPAAQTINVSNTGGGTLSWTAGDDASWLSVSPTSGTNNGTVTVTPSISGLAAGTYTASVTIDGGAVSGSPQTIPVTLTIAPPPPPSLALSPTTMTFNATQGGTNPGAQTASVTNGGSGSLDVSVSDDASWLTVTPATATAPATLTVAPSISGLAAGTYTATVTVTATTAGATGSPKTIAVTLNVAPAGSSGLVGAWSFNEASGTTAGDASGNGNTGTIAGAAHTTAGKYGGALSFDGASNWVTIPDSSSLNLTTGMTLEAWVNPTVIGTAWRTVVLKEQQPSSLIYSLYAGNAHGKPATDVFTSADKQVNGSSNTPLNTWTHLAATYDRSTLRLYVNGVQVASKAVTGTIKTTTDPLRIGGNAVWGEYFAGLIDEVRVYNKALTAAQIQADMTTPVG